MENRIIDKYNEILERDALPPRISSKELFDRIRKDKREIAELYIRCEDQTNNYKELLEINKILIEEKEQLMANLNYYKNLNLSLQRDLKREIDINNVFIDKIEMINSENDKLIEDRNSLVLLVNELNSKTIINKVKDLINNHKLETNKQKHE